MLTTQGVGGGVWVFRGIHSPPGPPVDLRNTDDRPRHRPTLDSAPRVRVVLTVDYEVPPVLGPKTQLERQHFTTFYNRRASNQIKGGCDVRCVSCESPI